MDNSDSVNTKKCPHCGQWSTWNLHYNDRCTHCGELLDPQAYKSALHHAEEERKAEKAPKVFIQTNPTDSTFTRLWKYAVLSGQVLFAAIISFFVWLGVAVAS